MKQYLDICKRILSEGVVKPNRTGIDTIGIQGVMMQFDMDDGFPAVTTKRLAWKAAFAEMLGFLRGYDNAADFRKLGCNVWNANSVADYWTSNPNYEGDGDLGRIYGVQARRWQGLNYTCILKIDQLKMCIDDLSQGIDNRREIVTHWNPSQMKQMALPPCHLLYQFGIQGDRLNLSMYQRSADFPLGIPFNIAGYSWLLHVVARITGLQPGVFTHFIHDAHIYANQVELMKEQVEREPFDLPMFVMSDRLRTLGDMEDERLCAMDDFHLVNYNHHPAIKYPFAV